MSEKSILRETFEAHPIATAIALAAPFGLVALGAYLAFAKLRRRRGSEAGSLPPKKQTSKRRRCNLCGKRRRADGQPCPTCHYRDGQCGVEDPNYWDESKGAKPN